MSIANPMQSPAVLPSTRAVAFASGAGFGAGAGRGYLVGGGTGPNVPPTPQYQLTAAAHRRRPVVCFRIPLPLLSPFPTFVAKVRVVGNNKIPEKVVLDALQDIVGTRTFRTRIVKALKAAEDWYTKNHYIGSKAIVGEFPSTANHNTLVILCVEVVLASLRLVGLDKDENLDPAAEIRTRDSVVCRALGLKMFDVFRWHPSAFQRMMALGVFEFARVELEQIGPTDVGVLVSVREFKTSRVEPGVGVSSDGTVYGDVSGSDANFMGRAQRVRVEWQRRMGMARSAGGIDFEDPRIGARIPFMFKARFYRDSNASRQLLGGAGREDIVLENERDRDGVLVQFGWSVPRFDRLLLTAGPVLERINALANAAASRSDFQGMMNFSALYDVAERSLLPRNGFRVSSEYVTGSTLNRRRHKFFHRIASRISAYLPVAKQASVAIGITAGTGTSNLPKYEQKALGGPGTLRGYIYGELGRALSFATCRIELRVPLVTPKPEIEGDQKADPVKDRSTAASTASEDSDKPVTRTKSVLRFRATERSMQDAKVVATEDSILTRDDDNADNSEKDSTKKLTLPKLPSLVGVIFADSASREIFSGHVVGGSYGIGLRIGGMISVEYAQARTGRGPGLHFGIVDRNL